MPTITKKINKVTIRMYCMGTGDCFVLKFFSDRKEKFTMMIDCGSCRGGVNEFRPYLENLKGYVKKGIDLLVVTHEHQDHVNGFYKCKDVFNDITIKEAWFAWTEDPKDKNNRQAELLEKRQKLRLAYSKAMNEFINQKPAIEANYKGDHNYGAVISANNAFLQGLNTLADINLPAMGEPESVHSLAGMEAIKEKLKKDDVEVKYLNPGTIETIKSAPGLKFYILGPPWDRDSVFKDGKEGTDVYKKYFAQNQNLFTATSFTKIGSDLANSDFPFDEGYISDDSSANSSSNYYNPSEAWRKIDNDWLMGVGSLAMRLDSHLNNTSLVIAIEFEDSGKVLLFPGDAEFGNWESWHIIKNWIDKGKNGRPLAEDLLSRTVFLKAGHHLSYNGTALKKGIEMMPSSGMVSMASLDRKRISENWKNTMPNKSLLQELIKRCNGRVFIMNEEDIEQPPSETIKPEKIAEFELDKNDNLYKQYTIKL